MQNDDSLSSTAPLLPSAIVTQIGNLDKEITKLKSRYQSRRVLLVFGVILAIFWGASYVSATIATNQNSASVSMLAPILYFPVLVFGILFIILGIVGGSAAKKKVVEAEAMRVTLEKALEEGKRQGGKTNNEGILPKVS